MVRGEGLGAYNECTYSSFIIEESADPRLGETINVVYLLQRHGVPHLCVEAPFDIGNT